MNLEAAKSPAELAFAASVSVYKTDISKTFCAHIIFGKFCSYRKYSVNPCCGKGNFISQGVAKDGHLD